MIEKSAWLRLIIFSLLITSLVFWSCATIFSYQLTIVGRIVDDDDSPMRNIKVFTENDVLSCKTNNSGVFELDGLAYENSSICIYCIIEGHRTILDCVDFSYSDIDTFNNEGYIDMGTYVYYD